MIQTSNSVLVTAHQMETRIRNYFLLQFLGIQIHHTIHPRAIPYPLNLLLLQTIVLFFSIVVEFSTSQSTFCVFTTSSSSCSGQRHNFIRINLSNVFMPSISLSFTFTPFLAIIQPIHYKCLNNPCALATASSKIILIALYNKHNEAFCHPYVYHTKFSSVFLFLPQFPLQLAT